MIMDIHFIIMSVRKTPAQRKEIRLQKEQEKSKRKLFAQELIETVFSMKDLHRLILLDLPLMDQTSFNSITKRWNKPLSVRNDEFDVFTHIKQLLLCHCIHFKGKTNVRNPLTGVTYSFRGPELDDPYESVIRSLEERKIPRSKLRLNN